MNHSNAIDLYVCCIRLSFLKIDSSFYRLQFWPDYMLGIKDTGINMYWECRWSHENDERRKKRGKNGEAVMYFELFSPVLITPYMDGVMELQSWDGLWDHLSNPLILQKQLSSEEVFVACSRSPGYLVVESTEGQTSWLLEQCYFPHIILHLILTFL